MNVIVNVSALYDGLVICPRCTPPHGHAKQKSNVKFTGLKCKFRQFLTVFYRLFCKDGYGFAVLFIIILILATTAGIFFCTVFVFVLTNLILESSIKMNAQNQPCPLVVGNGLVINLLLGKLVLLTLSKI